MSQNSLLSMTTSALLDAFASSAPTPGGGSASALAGAIGASLLAMVAAIPKTKTAAPQERAALDAAASTLNGLRRRLAELVDEDTRAYDLVTAAFRRPKGTDEEKAARKAAIQDALRAATDAPLETMRACEAVIREGAIVAANGNANAASDVFVGIELAYAGLRGAEKNVAINLGSLADEAFKESVVAEASRLMISGTDRLNAARDLLA